MEDILKKALEIGFTQVGVLDANTIKCNESVRSSCAENKCNFYGKNWACPPGCGDLKECETKIRNYKRGVIVQTTGELEDAMDYEAMMEIGEKHGETLQKLVDEVSQEYKNALFLGAGACTRCKSCTYPDAPCRFPDKMISSMEAYGLNVSEVCSENNIKYYYGNGTLTYTSCVLID